MNAANRALYARHWFGSRSRLLLTVGGIAIGAALFVTSVAVPWSVSRSVDTYLSLGNRATIEVAATSDAGAPGDLADRLRAVDGVTAAASVVRSGVRLDVAGHPQGDLLLLGLDQGAAAIADPDTVDPSLSSALATALTDHGDTPAVFAGARAADDLDLQAGDTITVVAANGNRSAARVAGVLPAGPSSSIANGQFLLSSLPVAATLAGKTGRVDSVFIVPTTSAVESELLDRLRQAARGEAMPAPRAWRQQQADAVFAPLRGTMTLMAVVALGVGAFLTYNTVSMVAVERRREFAILRSLGASPRSIARNQRLQALILGAVGSILGAGIGALLAGQVVATLPPVISTVVGIKPNLALPWWCLPGALLAGVVTTLVGAEAPIRSTLQIRPLEALRDDLDTPTEAEGRSIRPARLAVAVALLLLGLWAAFVGGRAIVPASLLLLLAAAVVGVSASTTALAATCRVLLAVRPGWGHVVASSLRRSPRRLSGTLSALIAAGVLIVAITGMTDDMSASIESMIGSLGKTDMWVQTAAPEDLPVQAPMPTEWGSTLQARTGARGVVAGQMLFASVDTRRVLVQGVDGPSNTGIVQRATDAARQSMLRGEGMIVSSQFAEQHHLHAGDTYELASPTGTHQVAVLDVIRMLVPSDGGQISLSLSRLQTWFDRPGATWFELDYGGHAPSVESVQSVVRDLAGGNPLAVSVTTGASFSAATRGAMAQLMSVFQLVALIVVCVSGMAVTNTLMISVHERRRELAMLYAAGSSPKRLRRMVVAEALALGTLGGVIGAALGAAGRHGAVRSIEVVSGFPVDARFSIATLATGAVAVLVISALGALLPAVHAGRIGRTLSSARS